LSFFTDAIRCGVWFKEITGHYLGIVSVLGYAAELLRIFQASHPLQRILPRDDPTDLPGKSTSLFASPPQLQQSSLLLFKVAALVFALVLYRNHEQVASQIEREAHTGLLKEETSFP
jgi:hypothetical protein